MVCKQSKTLMTPLSFYRVPSETDTPVTEYRWIWVLRELVRTLTSQPTGYLLWAKLPPFFKPQFSHLLGGANNIDLIRWLRGFNATIHLKYSAECQARYPLKGSYYQ